MRITPAKRPPTRASVRSSRSLRKASIPDVPSENLETSVGPQNPPPPHIHKTRETIAQTYPDILPHALPDTPHTPALQDSAAPDLCSTIHSLRPAARSTIHSAIPNSTPATPPSHQFQTTASPCAPRSPAKLSSLRASHSRSATRPTHSRPW